MADVFKSQPSPTAGNEETAAAAHWVARHDRGLSAEESADFAAWRRAAPAHAAEFARIEGVWGRADGLKADAGLSALAGQIDVLSLQAQRRRQAARGRVIWGGGLAAAAAVALAWAAWWRAPATSETLNVPSVAVVPATSQRLILADGSVVELRAGGEVRPQFTPTERRVRLVRGEAHFQVTKDAARPFIVEAGGLAVRAVGTTFNVRLDPSAVEVIVTEGKISLQETAAGLSAANTPTMVAGQRAVVEIASKGGVVLAAAMIETTTSADIEHSLSWQGTRLVLTRATLADAVEAFNRHGAQKIEIGDELLRSRRLSGTFRADNADALVRLLEQAAEVRVERRDDGAVVLRAAR